MLGILCNKVTNLRFKYYGEHFSYLMVLRRPFFEIYTILRTQLIWNKYQTVSSRLYLKNIILKAIKNYPFLYVNYESHHFLIISR